MWASDMSKEKGITSVTIRLTEGTEAVLSMKEAKELYNSLHLLFGRSTYPIITHPMPMHSPSPNYYKRDVWC